MSTHATHLATRPIGRLNEDLWLQVFQLIILQEPEAVWALSAVCQQWRQVAISCSSLWTNILYEAYTHPTRDLHKSIATQFHRVVLQLERSTTKQLKVSMSLQGSLDFVKELLEMQDGPQRVVEHFAENAHRTVSLRLEAGFDERHTSKLFPPPPFSFKLSNLRDLTLCNQGGTFDGGIFDNRELFSDTPALRSLSVRDTHIHPSVSFPKLAWDKLTNLEFLRCNTVADEVLNILRLAKGLESLAIHESGWYAIDGEEQEQQFRPVHLPCLTSINISLGVEIEKNWFSMPNIASLDEAEEFHDYVSIVMAHIQAPCLDSLVVQDLSKDTCFDSIEEFLHHSHRPPIRVLHLCGDFDPEWASDIIEVLEQIPALEELRIEEECTIENPDDTLNLDPLLRRLSSENDSSMCPKLGTPISPILCTSLKSLHVLGVRITLPTLQSFVQSRSGSNANSTDTPSLRKLEFLSLQEPIWVSHDQEDAHVSPQAVEDWLMSVKEANGLGYVHTNREEQAVGETEIASSDSGEASGS